MGSDITRRSFLKLAAAAGAVLSTESCHAPGEKLIPYLVPDQNTIPGVPAFYRTVCNECDSGCGVVARVREGRVIKLEGNPSDPINAGALCARGQASLQGLYNPDRLSGPRRRGANGLLRPVKWQAAIAEISAHCKQAAAAGANRIAFIGRAAGPTSDDVTRAFVKSFNSENIVYFEPLNMQRAAQAATACFGQNTPPTYRIDRAQVLISFGADFLETWHSPVELARQYAHFRAPRKPAGDRTIGLAYYVGSRMSITAAKTDRLIMCPPGSEYSVALAILHAMLDQGHLTHATGMNALKTYVADFAPEAVAKNTGIPAKQIRQMASAFGRAQGAVALAGTDDINTHIAAMLMNAVTGNVGKTQVFLQPEAGLFSAPRSGGQESLIPLIDAMNSGTVQVLIIAESNPAYSTSGQLRLAEAIKRVPFVVWAGGVPDETATLAHLLLPIDHPLEQWSDNVPRPGVHTLGQPVMARVFESRALIEIMMEVMRAADIPPPWADSQTAVQQRWADLFRRRGAANFEDAWTAAQRAGGLFFEAPPTQVHLDTAVLKKPPALAKARQATLVAYPHIFFYDGRGADKPWLQENPDPIAQIVWDSWAEIHPDTARRLGISTNDVVELETPLGSIEVPAKVAAGVHPDAVAVPLGQGHTAYGRYAKNRGANPWPILPPDSLHAPVTIKRTGKVSRLVSPLYTADMMGRPIVETISLDDVNKGIKPPPAEPPPPEPWELWPPRVYPKHRWGMTIDLNACSGCGACVTACYAENNLHLVGKSGVEAGRIMSWLRLERYMPDLVDAPQILIMPMLCQQCDHAPCEPVCPVYASYHTEEGLNAQIYNRCIGTRYCENNCPYKVRRFNWFKPEFAEPMELQLNPDVTVRGAGVMEKCTFCVQRIRAVEITATIQERPVYDGEIIPACAQTCPSGAITFGDMLDEHSMMMRRRKENAIRTYRALEELNTRPSITYLRTIYRKASTLDNEPAS